MPIPKAPNMPTSAPTKYTVLSCVGKFSLDNARNSTSTRGGKKTTRNRNPLILNLSCPFAFFSASPQRMPTDRAGSERAAEALRRDGDPAGLGR